MHRLWRKQFEGSVLVFDNSERLLLGPNLSTTRNIKLSPSIKTLSRTIMNPSPFTKGAHGLGLSQKIMDISRQTSTYYKATESGVLSLCVWEDPIVIPISKCKYGTNCSDHGPPLYRTFSLYFRFTILKRYSNFDQMIMLRFLRRFWVQELGNLHMHKYMTIWDSTPLSTWKGGKARGLNHQTCFYSLSRLAKF